MKDIIKVGGKLLCCLALIGCVTKAPVVRPGLESKLPEITGNGDTKSKNTSRPKNGSIPYEEYYGIGEWDLYFRGNNSLLIENADDAFDFVVFLERISKEVPLIAHNVNYSLLKTRVVRHNYIRAGSSYEMIGIPNGDYFIKIIIGKDWNPDKFLFDGRIRGGFDTEMSFTISNNPAEFLHMRRYTDGEGRIYCSKYEVQIFSSSGANMGEENEGDFFN